MVFSDKFLEIESPSNPQVKLVKSLYEKKERQKENAFILEGERIFRDAVDSKISLKKIFVTKKLRDVFFSDLMSFANKKIPIYLVSEPVMAKLSATKSPQGILAVAEMSCFEFSSSWRFILILDGIKDPGNAGTLIRSAEASGAEAVIFAPGCVDPYNEKVVRSGMGAHFRLPIFSDWSYEEISDHLSSFQFNLADLDAETSYTDVSWSEKSALVIGGEANGAGPELRKKSRSIKIPMIGGTESLNAAMAGTIIMFEALRQRNQSK